MNHPFTTLEPLADYLQSEFGNIYEYNFKGEGQFEVQEWTGDLKQAVKGYLMEKAPEDLGNQVIDKLASATHDTESREQRVASIIERYEPWEIAHTFHEAAVIAVPTSHALIGYIDHWSYENERIDASLWLAEHATEDQLMQVVQASRGIEALTLAREHEHSDPAETLVRTLDPPALLATWDEAFGAPSDLTDDEWELLVPLLPRPPRSSRYPARWLPAARKGLDGIFYWLTNRVLWSHVPSRYGEPFTVHNRWFRYKQKGVFRRMYLGLQDKPEAKRIVEWLRALDRNKRL